MIESKAFNFNYFMSEVCKEIKITGERIVKDIQLEFNSYYPYLKMEFLKTDSDYSSSKNYTIDPGASFNQIIALSKPVNINLENNRTISDVEKDFQNLLGLSIQVLRKSGKIWNVISLTDSWTLESQNKAGEFISSEMKTGSS